MPRRARAIVGGLIYHVLNRSNGRVPLFRKEADYDAFLRVLDEAHRRMPLPILAYCVMPNHWHFLVLPEENRARDVSEFFRWLTVTHAQRWHAHYKTSGSGHLYQGRFKSFPIEADDHFFTVARYVERNALRAGLAERAEAWRFGSLWRHSHPQQADLPLLTAWPLPRPANWINWVNDPQTDAEVEAIRRCIKRCRPFGSDTWITEKARQLGLEWTIRPRGRPRKE